MMFRVCLALFIFFYGLTPEKVAADCVGNNLAEIQESINEGDADRFKLLVKVDDILNDSLSTFLDYIRSPENSSALPPLLALVLSGISEQPALRKLLLEECRAFVLNGIQSGSFGGKKSATGESRGMLAPLFADASTGRKEIISKGVARKEDNGWIAPFTVRDHGNGNDYPVLGFFEENMGTCRLTAIRNLDELFEQIGREARQQ